MPYKDAEKRKQYYKNYYKKNKEEIIKVQKTWLKNNPDKRKQHVKNHYLKNKKKILGKAKEYRKTNKQMIIKSGIKYRENNMGKIKEKIKTWRKNNPDKRNAIEKRYRDKNPKKIKAYTISKNIPLRSCCEICGDKEKLEKHHWNYEKPLLVNTLCNFCHNTQHKKRIYGIGGLKS